MYDADELLWNASIEEIKKGYVYKDASEEYVCLICGRAFTKGVIYPKDDVLLEAERAVKIHIDDSHGSVFKYLLNLDRKLTGLSELQKSLLGYFYDGLSDSDIVAEFDGGSTSTIRNHRFMLKQKEKQAKIFLCLMELLKENKNVMKQEFVNVHKSATMVDERYAITKEENDKILKIYFNKGLDGRLAEFPVREKRKIIVLKHLAKRFEAGKRYTEKEVNEILKRAYDDYVTLRRYMIEYGFMDRQKDGSSYWIKEY